MSVWPTASQATPKTKAESRPGCLSGPGVTFCTLRQLNTAQVTKQIREHPCKVWLADEPCPGRAALILVPSKPDVLGPTQISCRRVCEQPTQGSGEQQDACIGEPEVQKGLFCWYCAGCRTRPPAHSAARSHIENDAYMDDFEAILKLHEPNKPPGRCAPSESTNCMHCNGLRSKPIIWIELALAPWLCHVQSWSLRNGLRQQMKSKQQILAILDVMYAGFKTICQMPFASNPSSMGLYSTCLGLQCKEGRPCSSTKCQDV